MPPVTKRTWGGRMRGSSTRRWSVPGEGTALRRTAAAAWPILQQTAAAAIAWVIAVYALHRSAPFFAPIAAVVGLNATLGRRGSQAVRLLLGVVVGIVVGEVAVAVAGGGGVWTLTAATFAAMVVARLLDSARVVIAQAAVAAILITAFGDFAEGKNRLIEALIGGGVALLFSQVVFPPDPLRLLRRSEAAVLRAMAGGLRLTADALEHDEPELAERALADLRALRDRLADLASMRKASDRVVRHSVTWRSKEAPVVRERERADQLDLLAGSCLLLTRTAPETSASQRAALSPGVRRLAQALADLAVQPGDRTTRQRAAEEALQLGRWRIEPDEAGPAQPLMVAAGAAVRMVAFDVMVFAGVVPGEAREALDGAVRGPDPESPGSTAR
jgi:uncharacterized membrane protein YgaE (UPF0421/DUF939 family)